MENRDGRIKEIAYRLWELAGRPDGELDRFWHAAIEEYEAETRRLRAVAKELAAAQPKTTSKAPRRSQRRIRSSSPSRKRL